jgi:hypothetical protein
VEFAAGVDGEGSKADVSAEVTATVGFARERSEQVEEARAGP